MSNSSLIPTGPKWLRELPKRASERICSKQMLTKQAYTNSAPSRRTWLLHTKVAYRRTLPTCPRIKLGWQKCGASHATIRLIANSRRSIWHIPISSHGLKRCLKGSANGCARQWRLGKAALRASSLITARAGFHLRYAQSQRRIVRRGSQTGWFRHHRPYWLLRPSFVCHF